jgi:hypothetical protein
MALESNILMALSGLVWWYMIMLRCLRDEQLQGLAVSMLSQLTTSTISLVEQASHLSPSSAAHLHCAQGTSTSKQNPTNVLPLIVHIIVA